MNINRNNYEEFFLLYADKELSASDSKAVEAFAATHPDLQAELELLLQTILPQESAAVFMDKDILFRTTDTGSLVNMTNYESYFVKYCDDELNNQEKAATEQFIYEHPECQSEFELIRQIKFQPDTDVIFPDKSLLYRKEEESRRPVIVLWMRFAAAAILILVAGIYWLHQTNKAVINQPPLVVNKPAVTVPGEVVKENPAIKEKELLATSEKSPSANSAAQPKTENQGVEARTQMQKQPLKTSHLQVAKNEPVAEQQVPELAFTKPLAEETKTDALVKEELPVINTGKTVPDNTEAVASTSYASNAAKEDYIYVDNSPEVRKTPLRGFLRKATRFVEQKNPLSPDHKKGGVFTASHEQ